MTQLNNRWVFLCFAVLLVAISTVYFVVDVPDTPQLARAEGKVTCHEYAESTGIDVSKPLNIAVWNIYKQQMKGWDVELKRLGEENSLILLQEAQSKPDLISHIDSAGWHSNQAYAFAVNGEIAGVMTLSESVPEKVCAYTKVEPYLRLPKSALYSAFPLSNGELLSVINLHSINFTYGVKEYGEQIDALVDGVRPLSGPIIIAGDFNTWSLERMELMNLKLGELGLEEAQFEPDERLRVFSHPLDHVFYRGMTLESATTTDSGASDHAILEASFSLDQK